MRTKILLLAATALVSTSVFAQTADIAILSGGVGSSERAMIEAQQHNFSTKLVFSGQGGAYVSSVNVVVKDKAGATVLNTITEGPILLANLPSGSYHVSATASGIEKTQKITAGRTMKTYQMVFPITDNPELTGENGTYLPKAASTLDNNYTAPAPTYYGGE